MTRDDSVSAEVYVKVSVLGWHQDENGDPHATIVVENTPGLTPMFLANLLMGTVEMLLDDAEREGDGTGLDTAE